MTKSDESPEWLDLERAVPTTREDVAALKTLRAAAQKMDLRAYLDFLARFPAPPNEQLRIRKGPRGLPFSLG